MTERLVKRSYRYRFYPSAVQAEQLSRLFGSVRYVYNRALAERRAAWQQEGRTVGYVETSRMLTAWKREPETAWLLEVPSVPLQASLRNLQSAYTNFWQKRAKYPTFKKRGKSVDSATYVSGAFSYRDGQIKLARLAEPLKIYWSRPLPDGSEPSSVTISRNARGQYYISILLATSVAEFPRCDTTVGLDLGITDLVTLSTGEKVANPRLEQQYRAKIRRAQKKISRKKKGSNNRAKARFALAKIYGRLADSRQDFLHKLTTRIIRENQTVVVEDLSVRTMVRNRKVSRAISNSNWFELRRQLEYKAEWYGRTLVAVDRFYPSTKTCSSCGAVANEVPLAVRQWQCICGARHDRDINAAKNLRAAGLAVLACRD